MRIRKRFLVPGRSGGSPAHCFTGHGSLPSNSQGPGGSNLGNRSSSASLGQYEEPDLLRTNSSKRHRFRLVGCPGFNGIQPRWPAAATMGRRLIDIARLIQGVEDRDAVL